MQVGGLLYQPKAVDDACRGDNPTDAKPRKRNLRKAVDLDHQIRTIKLLERRNTLAAGAKPRVNMIFDDRHLKARREFEQPPAFGNRERRPGRIVEVRR